MNYDWDLMTAAQARGFKATDTIWAPHRSLSKVSVTFDDATRTFAIADSHINRTLVFTSEAYGAKLEFGTTGLYLWIGSIQSDYIDATRNDGAKVYAGSGADTIIAAATVSGGTGDDTLVMSLSGGHVLDWERGDRLYFGGQAASGANYQELSAADTYQAERLARGLLTSGTADYVAVAVGADVHLYADTPGDNLSGWSYTPRVTLAGRTLDDISPAHILSGPPPAAPPLPPPPTTTPPPSTGQRGANGTVTGNMEIVQIGRLQGAAINEATSTALQIAGGGGGAQIFLSGTGLTYDSHQQLVAGVVKALIYGEPGFHAHLSFDNGTSAAPLGTWVAANATQVAFATLLAGNDTLTSSSGNELIRGYGGDDRLESGFGGDDTLIGGAGNDLIRGYDGWGAGNTYLRGEEGDDVIVGGSKFDDINGNQGNDSGSGGAGDDWVVGGKDNDVVAGDAGNDIVYGNLGHDTCDGGLGSDTVRGGQGADLVFGSDGDDYVSGDRGDDTVTGGLGADLFHTFGDAGLDRVTDFTSAAGDRVLLDPGTQYTVSQSGADTVISMTGGGQMVLVGVQLSSLPAGWIFVG